MEVMWMIVLTVGLLCWASEGQISCKNEANGAVDWYILYKEPCGFDSIYIDSTMNKGFKRSTKPVNHQDGFLANTLGPIFTNTRECKYIAYSDQPPPNTKKKSKCGHSKGVVMVDGDAVVWLRESNNFYPSTGERNAQIFICVTFPVSELNKIETHLGHIRANIFDSNITKFSAENSFWTSNEKLNDEEEECLYQELKSKDKQEFICIFKKISNKIQVGDLYVTIGNRLETNVYAQTWGGQPKKCDSYCPENGHKVYNIESIKSNLLGQWNRGSDHSKWSVSEDKDWTCIADSNRAVTQFKRPGGALCIKNKAVKKAFMTLIKSQKQTRKRPRDNMKNVQRRKCKK